jgi:hypothetical protein
MRSNLNPYVLQFNAKSNLFVKVYTTLKQQVNESKPKLGDDFSILVKVKISAEETFETVPITTNKQPAFGVVFKIDVVLLVSQKEQ